MSTNRKDLKRKKTFLTTYRTHCFHHHLNESELFGPEHVFTTPNSTETITCRFVETITCRFVESRRLCKDSNGYFNESSAMDILVVSVKEPRHVYNFHTGRVSKFVIEAALCAGMHPMKCFANPDSAVEFFKAVGISASDLDLYQNLKCSPKETADIIRELLRVRASNTMSVAETIDFDFSDV